MLKTLKNNDKIQKDGLSLERGSSKGASTSIAQALLSDKLAKNLLTKIVVNF